MCRIPSAYVLAVLVHFALILSIRAESDPLGTEDLAAEDLITRMEVVPESLHEATQIIKKYVSQIDAVGRNDKPTQEQLALLASWMKKPNLLKMLEHAQATLEVYKDTPLEEEPHRKEDLLVLAQAIKKLNGHVKLSEAAEAKTHDGPAPQEAEALMGGFRRATEKEATEIAAFIRGLMEMFQAQKYLELIRTKLVIEPPLPEGMHPELAKKLDSEAKDHIEIMKSLLEKPSNWYVSADGKAILVRSRSEWTKVRYRHIDLVRSAGGEWKCKSVSSVLPQEVDQGVHK
ncbi:MAG: hypothetical protein HS116_08820 [Planctomycetes bacterium]|nr:hypothetical protein [Planctomycetota bacterium]